MYDVSVELIKEGHKQYLNTVGHIKVKEDEYEASAKKVLLYVQHREGESNGNEVINVDDLDDAAAMHGTYSLELFENEFELAGGSIERVRDKTQKSISGNTRLQAILFTSRSRKTKRVGTLADSIIILHRFLLMKK